MFTVFALKLVVYGILLLLTMIFLYRGQQNVYVGVKTLTSLTFLWTALTAPGEAASSPVGWGIVIGLVFCVAGDVLLALGHEIDNVLINKWFQPGVVSFLMAHLFLCGSIILLMPRTILLYLLIAAAGLVTVLITVLNGRNPDYDFQGNLTLCTVYSFFVGGLLGSGVYVLLAYFRLGEAAGPGLLLLGIGGIIFLLSDLILSFKLFYRKKNQLLPALVLLLYYPATMCFALFLYTDFL